MAPALYEIELAGTDAYGDPYYHTMVVRGPWRRAGEVPEGVRKHARLLACIAGHEVHYRIGYHEPVTITDDGQTMHARTVWLTDETYPATERATR
jgi:hypothetical protein